VEQAAAALACGKLCCSKKRDFSVLARSVLFSGVQMMKLGFFDATSCVL